MRRKKEIEQICKNCKLYNPKEGVCAITIVGANGEHLELKTNPEDSCHWIEAGLVNEIKQMRAWSDGKQGYIEY